MLTSLSRSLSLLQTFPWCSFPFTKYQPQSKEKLADVVRNRNAVWPSCHGQEKDTCAPSRRQLSVLDFIPCCRMNSTDETLPVHVAC